MALENTFPSPSHFRQDFLLPTDPIQASYTLWIGVVVCCLVVLSFAQHGKSMAMRLVKLGPIPGHVGFIMDGNRRFARKTNVETTQGHQKGFKQLENTLAWCMTLGVKTVTVYAFSIENFKRNTQEVEELMCMANEKMKELAARHDLIERYKVRVRVCGELQMLPKEVEASAQYLMKMTQENAGEFFCLYGFPVKFYVVGNLL